MRCKYDIDFLKKCKYPNLVAEIKETGYSICTISEFMGHGRREEDDEFILGKIYGTYEILANEAIGLSKLFNCGFKYLFDDKLQVFSEKPIAYWRHYESNKAQEWDRNVYKLSEDVRRTIRRKPYLYETIQWVLNMTEEQTERLLNFKKSIA